MLFHSFRSCFISELSLQQ